MHVLQYAVIGHVVLFQVFSHVFSSALKVQGMMPSCIRGEHLARNGLEASTAKLDDAVISNYTVYSCACVYHRLQSIMLCLRAGTSGCGSDIDGAT